MTGIGSVVAVAVVGAAIEIRNGITEHVAKNIADAFLSRLHQALG